MNRRQEDEMKARRDRLQADIHDFQMENKRMTEKVAELEANQAAFNRRRAREVPPPSGGIWGAIKNFFSAVVRFIAAPFWVVSLFWDSGKNSAKVAPSSSDNRPSYSGSAVVHLPATTQKRSPSPTPVSNAASYSSPTSAHTGGVRARGEQINRIEKRAERLENAADDFAAQATRLREQAEQEANKPWWKPW